MTRTSVSAVRPDLLETTSYSEPRFRAALLQLTEPHTFLASDEGVQLLQQLELRVVPGVVAAARTLGLGREWLQPQEILHTVLLALCEERARLAVHIAETAADPWSYLARCAVKWARDLWGVRGDSFDQAPEWNSAGALHLQQQLARADDGLTPLSEVIELAHGALVSHTPQRLQRSLHTLLCWLAANPPQRVSHEAADRAAAQRHHPEFSQAQIAAVANMAWGTRPRRRETSLFAALLKDPEFLISNSPTHARALLQYRRVMRSQPTLVEAAERLAA